MFQRILGDLRSRRRYFVSLLIPIALAMLVASCDEPPKRAVPPGAVREIATVTPTAGANGASSTSGGFIRRTVLDATLPPAEQVYFTQGADIWRVPLEDDPSPVTEGESLAGFSASATGHRVAILRIERDAGTTSERVLPSVLLPDGSVHFDLASFNRSIDFDQLSPINSLALSPAGDALAMTHQNGAVSKVSLDGDIDQLVEPEAGRQPGQLAWSSDGRFLTYLDPWSPNSPSALYLLRPDRSASQVLVEPNREGFGVTQAAWIPGTSHVLYIKSSGSTITYGGDVLLVDATTGEQRLLFSSSEIAPVAGLVDFAVSPDGGTVALTGFVPGDDYPSFAGLWFLELPDGELKKLSMDLESVVSDLWWLGDDLLLRTIDEPRTDLPGTYTGQEMFQLLSYDRESGDLEERYTSEVPADSSENDDPVDVQRRITNR